MEDEPEVQNNARKYLRIKHLLESEFDLSRLPITAEVKYVKYSGDKYAHVILKLDKTVKSDYWLWPDLYNFKWNVDEESIPREHYLPYILPDIEEFLLVMALLNKNEIPLTVSLIGGSHRVTERSNSFKTATFMAMEELLKKLV